MNFINKYINNAILCYLLFLLGTAQLCSGQAVTIDTSFGENGFSKIAFESSSYKCGDAVVQKDDKIILAGTFDNENIITIRLNQNGEIDSTYATNGTLNLKTNGFRKYRSVNAVDLNDDGSLILGGCIIDDSMQYITNAALLKLTKYGTLDTSFGVNGLVFPFFNTTKEISTINDVAIQNDKKILFCGTSGSSSPYNTSYFVVGRCLPNGEPDLTFGENGIITTAFAGQHCEATHLLIQHNGSVLVGGSADGYFAFVRYNLTGVLDATFGNNGKLITNLGTAGALFDIVEKDNQHIVAAGYILYKGIGDCNPYYRNIVMELKNDGVPSENFYNEGSNVYLTGYCVSIAKSILFQSDQKILIGGSGGILYSNGVYSYTVSRLFDNGELDESIGNDGYKTFKTGLDENYCAAMAYQSDGKIIMAGYSIEGAESYFTAFRVDAGIGVPGSHVVEYEKANIWSYNKTIYLSNEETQNVDCSLMNSIGQVVYNFSAQPGNSTIDLPQLADGCYILSMQLPNHNLTYKLLLTN